MASMASALPGGPFYDPELKRSKITWGLQLKRKRLNVVALCGSIFAPWILFCLVSGIWIVDVAYKEPNQMLVIALLFLLVCVIFGAKAIQTWMAGNRGMKSGTLLGTSSSFFPRCWPGSLASAGVSTTS